MTIQEAFEASHVAMRELGDVVVRVLRLDVIPRLVQRLIDRLFFPVNHRMRNLRR